jgi:sec-independent protein translocase protein TatC
MTRFDEQAEPSQTLIDHLTELRKRLIRSVWCILLGMFASYYYSAEIFDFLRGPIRPYLPDGGLVFTAPTDKFMAHLKISIFSGVLITCPLWMYQLWKFVAPALYAKEKNYAIGFIVSGTTLFVGGVSFAYFLVFPAAFEFLLTFGGSTDKAMITISEYLSFVLWMSAMFGVAFELPLVVVILGMLDLVTQKVLRQKRRFIVVGLAVVSAVLTPTPDAMSMLLMLIPMWVLFEISILLVGFFERKKRDREATP